MSTGLQEGTAIAVVVAVVRRTSIPDIELTPAIRSVRDDLAIQLTQCGFFPPGGRQIDAITVTDRRERVSSSQASGMYRSG